MRLKRQEQPWPESAAQARALQRTRPAPPLRPLQASPRFILGLDCAFPPRGGEASGLVAAVVWDRERHQTVWHGTRRAPLTFPYAPGLLAFRELPLLLPLLEEVPEPVDAVMVDGQGIAHPQGLGIAAHLALWLERPIPVVGVAKSRLVGEHEAVPQMAGESVVLRYKGAVVGGVLRSKKRCRPLYVSPGGFCDVAGALDLVSACLRGYRLPEPTRLADRLSHGLTPPA